MSLNNYSIKKLTEKLRKIPSFKDLSTISILKEIPFFAEIDKSTLELKGIPDSIVITEYDSNDIICRYGKLDERFHIILSGKVKVIIPTEDNPRYELFKLGPGDFFGEDVILSNEPRENTIIAVEDTMTISMTQEVLNRLLSESERIKSLMDKQYIERKLRADITLMSPFYFGTGMDVEYFKNTDKFIKSMEFIEQALWDPVLGMLQRYLPFIEDPHTHIHAGNGPWLPYTSILAQYYFYIGNVERGKEILDTIDKYRSQEGYLCEHLTTPERFYEFKRFEWITGKDFDKELLTPEIMLPGIPYDFIVEELNNMKKAYDTIEVESKERGDKGYISFATPLMWSHAEYAMALMLKTEKEMVDLESKDM